MPFGLPPAWQSGFALPDNVLDEGLERRGLVTKQMPRGTYDNSPPDPTGGFAVPTYIRTEGYGQGARVTKWMRRGEYGPRVPQWIQKQPTVAKMVRKGDAKLVTVQRQSFAGLGGISGEPPMPEPFEAYGQRAAAAILSRINQLEPGVRKQQLKLILDQIDPSLWNRTAEITRRYVGQGLHAAEAFPRGLARALSAGIAAEMIRSGQTSSAPQPSSLLGLGIDHAQRAQGANGTYVGLGAAYVPKSSRPAAYVPKSAGLTPAQATALADATIKQQIANVMAGPRVMVGNTIPFPSSETKKYQYRFHTPSAIPAAWARFIGDTIKQIRSGVGREGVDVKKRAQFLADAEAGRVEISATGVNPWMKVPSNPWYQALGLPAGMVIPASFVGSTSDGDDDYTVNTANARNPLARFDHPGSGNPWGLYINMIPDRDNPKGISIWFKWIPDTGSWYSGIIKVIATIVGAPVKGAELVGEAVEELGELACQLATNPNAVNAGAAAGVAAGGGAAAGAAGAMIAQQLCGGAKAPVIPVPPPPPQDNLLPIVLIGGGVLVAAVLLTKKKRAP